MHNRRSLFNAKINIKCGEKESKILKFFLNPNGSWRQFFYTNYIVKL